VKHKTQSKRLTRKLTALREERTAAHARAARFTTLPHRSLGSPEQQWLRRMLACQRCCSGGRSRWRWLFIASPGDGRPDQEASSRERSV